LLQWPRLRWAKLFTFHNWLGYIGLAVAFAHPLILLTSSTAGFRLWHGGGGWHGGGWHGGWGGPRFFVGGPRFYGGYGYGGGCYVRQLVGTPWGPRWRLVNRCY